MRDLSVIIAARNEEFLARTVEGVLEKKRANTEVIVICDGNWPNPPIKDHPDVTIVYHPVSVGQRAAVNEGARLSQAKFIMKLDAHCVLDEGFDVKLMADCEYNWTVIPRMYNLHAFDWVCTKRNETKCDGRIYQGPSGKLCPKCGCGMEREMIWTPRWNRQSDFMRFDSDLHFQYWSDYKKRPEAQGDVVDIMSFVGACFFLHRQRYWDLGGSEEEWGSWGAQGTEISCKTWLSGGRLVVNKKTWFSHLFRTQGGDFSFPYPQSSKQVDHARKCSQELFLKNKWKGQKYSLYWLVKKFWPVPGWNESDLDNIMNASVSFSGVDSIANLAPSRTTTEYTNRKQVASNTVSSSGLQGGRTSPSQEIDFLGNKSKMGNIATPPIITDMINDKKVFSNSSGQRSNEPSVHDPMKSNLRPQVSDSSIPVVVGVTSPDPASSDDIKSDFRENTMDKIRIKTINNEKLRGVHSPHIIPQKGIIYYTDNQLKLSIAHACKKNIKSMGLPIWSASLKPMTDMGYNAVVPLKRGYRAYFTQILLALEGCQSEIVYFCEHDWLYHPSHFEFTPPRKDTFYYNWNWWRVRVADGHCVKYDTQLLPGVVAYRELLLDFYRKLLKVFEEMVISEGSESKAALKIGFEPGTSKRSNIQGDWRIERFDSTLPILDLRHTSNLTASKWTQDAFRSPKNCTNWQESTTVPGWGIMKDVLKELKIT